ncbi:type II toxin-antitoxin system RelE/ParE family toxin [Zoogloea sp. LCSB751]|uniref:type II toxin-antitoxin system RelE/ParE family toxin n=1 Tax=Zoogloea sp. LCSB751 TaxID=1965277 RepID=UPI0009A50167|nr:type II toxin-antitoxin system RelE/ParE family toxin [Zoogloea sp. LCSB751]
MVFVELTPFQAFRRDNWTDEDLRGLQSILIEHPDAGPLIPGAEGLRKLRWAMPGRGKRGGARVIYYWRTAADVVYLVFAYAKNDQEDLTPDQARQLAKLIEGVLRDE